MDADLHIQTDQTQGLEVKIQIYFYSAKSHQQLPQGPTMIDFQDVDQA